MQELQQKSLPTGQQLRERRIRLGIKNKKMAEDLGMARETIRAAETGVRRTRGSNRTTIEAIDRYLAARE